MERDFRGTGRPSSTPLGPIGIILRLLPDKVTPMGCSRSTCCALKLRTSRATSPYIAASSPPPALPMSATLRASAVRRVISRNARAVANKPVRVRRLTATAPHKKTRPACSGEVRSFRGMSARPMLFTAAERGRREIPSRCHGCRHRFLSAGDRIRPCTRCPRLPGCSSTARESQGARRLYGRAHPARRDPQEWRSPRASTRHAARTKWGNSIQPFPGDGGGTS